MSEMKGKWQDHLKSAEDSGLKLSEYATQHQIDVRRLREARRVRARQGTSAWAVVRVKNKLLGSWMSSAIISPLLGCHSPS